MKFACFGEICAPPMRWPLRPHASSILPALSSCSGFLKTLPKVRRFVGCASLRRAFSARDLGLDLRRTAARCSRSSAWTTTCPWRRPEWRYERPSSAGVSQPVPSARRDERPHEDLGELAAVGAARSSRRRRRSCRGSRTRTRTRRARRRVPCAAPRRSPRRRPARRSSPSISTSASAPASLSTSASTPSSATRRFEPSPTVATASSRSAAQRRSCSTSLHRLGTRERARRPAGAERREPRELDALLDAFTRAPRAGAARRGRRRPRRA